MMQQDDFLAQILAEEEAAAQKEEKARETARAEKVKYESTLEGARAEVLGAAKEESKTQFQTKQASAKELYQEMTKEGAREASSLKKEAEKKEEKILTSMQGAFLAEIL